METAGHPRSRGMPASLALGSRKQAPLHSLWAAFSYHSDQDTWQEQQAKRISFGSHSEENFVCHGRKAWCQECEAPSHIIAEVSRSQICPQYPISASLVYNLWNSATYWGWGVPTDQPVRDISHSNCNTGNSKMSKTPFPKSVVVCSKERQVEQFFGNVIMLWFMSVFVISQDLSRPKV